VVELETDDDVTVDDIEIMEAVELGELVEAVMVAVVLLVAYMERRQLPPHPTTESPLQAMLQSESGAF
jgi:hypothetical protein